MAVVNPDAEEEDLYLEAGFEGRVPITREANYIESNVFDLDIDTAHIEGRVLLINTGGTAGMRKTPDGYAPAPGYLTSQLELIIQREQFPDTEIIEYDPMVDSSDMTPTDWARIANDISDNYDDYSGFVVVHGTDTMAYTASALSFMLGNLSKPVVITGSMVPYEEPLADARRNILCSLIVAGYSGIPEVMVFFDTELFRGNRTTKISAWNLKGFSSPNYTPLATFDSAFHIRRALCLLPTRDANGNDVPLRLFTEMNLNVIVLTLIPGLSDWVLNLVEDSNVTGVVLVAFGSGNAFKRILQDVLRTLNQRGVVVVVISQCAHGTVDLETYAAGSFMTAAGCVSGMDMTLEAVVVKLSWLLGLEPPLTQEQIKRLMQTNIAGELTPRSEVEGRLRWVTSSNMRTAFELTDLVVSSL